MRRRTGLWTALPAAFAAFGSEEARYSTPTGSPYWPAIPNWRCQRRASVWRGPVFVLGHNGAVAWGVTDAGSDLQDFFMEPIIGGAPGRCDAPGGSYPFDERFPTIAVKGQDTGPHGSQSMERRAVSAGLRRAEAGTRIRICSDAGGRLLRLRNDIFEIPGIAGPGHGGFDRVVPMCVARLSAFHQ